MELTWIETTLISVALATVIIFTQNLMRNIKKISDNLSKQTDRNNLLSAYEKITFAVNNTNQTFVEDAKLANMGGSMTEEEQKCAMSKTVASAKIFMNSDERDALIASFSYKGYIKIMNLEADTVSIDSFLTDIITYIADGVIYQNKVSVDATCADCE